MSLSKVDLHKRPSGVSITIFLKANCPSSFQKHAIKIMRSLHKKLCGVRRGHFFWIHFVIFTATPPANDSCPDYIRRLERLPAAGSCAADCPQFYFFKCFSVHYSLKQICYPVTIFREYSTAIRDISIFLAMLSTFPEAC